MSIDKYAAFYEPGWGQPYIDKLHNKVKKGLFDTLSCKEQLMMWQRHPNI